MINTSHTLREYYRERVKVCIYRDLVTINHVSWAKVCSCQGHLTMSSNKPCAFIVVGSVNLMWP